MQREQHILSHLYQQLLTFTGHQHSLRTAAQYAGIGRAYFSSVKCTAECDSERVVSNFMKL